MTADYNFDKATCMICGNIGLIFVNNVRDDDNFWAAQCKKCKHIQLTPLPSASEDEKYYKTNEMIRRLIPEKEKNEYEMMMMYEKMGLMQSKSVIDIVGKEESILEIGSGYGWFIEKMLNEGYKVEGLEISEQKRQLVEQRTGIKLHHFNFATEGIPLSMIDRYDNVCMFHVLEHMSDPITFLKTVSKLVKKNGRIIIEVPNHDDYNKGLSAEYNNFTYFRGHLSYFTPKALQYVLAEAGFENMQVMGVQRYSIENALNWIRNGIPHTKYMQLELPKGLEWVNEFYKSRLEKELRSYAILAVGNIKI